MAAFDHNGVPGSSLDRELRGLNCTRCDRLSSDLAAARAERDALKAHAEALRSELYRYTDSVDNAAIRAFDEAMGAAVFGGGQPEATSGNTTTHSGKSVQATHSQECPDHEQKPPQPAHKGES